MGEILPKAYAQLVDDGSPAKEHSYGVIPLRYITPISPNAAPPVPTSSNTQVLLIKQRTNLPTMPNFWTFPKGHAEAIDTSNIETAIRELFEETGVTLKKERVLFEDKGGLVERYTNPTKGWIKEVRYWVALVEDSRVAGEGEKAIEVQQKEVDDAKWVSWEEAEELITFDKGKAILKAAKDLLEEM